MGYQGESEVIWQISRWPDILFETLQKVLRISFQLRVFFLSQVDDLVLVYFSADFFFFQTERVDLQRLLRWIFLQNKFLLELILQVGEIYPSADNYGDFVDPSLFCPFEDFTDPLFNYRDTLVFPLIEIWV